MIESRETPGGNSMVKYLKKTFFCILQSNRFSENRTEKSKKMLFVKNGKIYFLSTNRGPKLSRKKSESHFFYNRIDFHKIEWKKVKKAFFCKNWKKILSVDDLVRTVLRIMLSSPSLIENIAPSFIRMESNIS